MKTVLKWFIIAETIMGLSSYAIAQNTDFGKMAYEESCASCHGKDGTGNGPATQVMKTKVPNLTVLAKNNGGVFPVQKVYEIIDGRNPIPSHGTREMPIWGNAFLSFGPEYIVRNRILAIVDYLDRLQAK